MAALLNNTGVQSSGSVASVSKAYPSNVTAGNTLVAVGVVSSTTASLTSGQVTDTQGNSYTLRSNHGLSGVQLVGIWTAIAGSSGANTVTFDSGTDFMTLAIGEISGEVNPVVVDGTGGNNGSNASPVTTGQVTTVAGCVIGGVTHDGGSNQTITEGGGATLIYENQNTANMPISATFKATTAGTNNPSWTLGAAPTTRWDCCSAGLKDAAAPGGPFPPWPRRDIPMAFRTDQWDTG